MTVVLLAGMLVGSYREACPYSIVLQQKDPAGTKPASGHLIAKLGRELLLTDKEGVRAVPWENVASYTLHSACVRNPSEKIGKIADPPKVDEKPPPIKKPL